MDYDVIAYDVDVKVSPDRSLLEGNARLKSQCPGSAALRC